jgi:hypothetical protein
MTWLWNSWRSPVLAPMLANRRLSAAFAVLGVVQIGAGLFHLHTFTCPMLASLGVPCPGCGASRACAALLRGDFKSYATLHLLAPMFLVAVVLCLCAAVLPRAGREALVRGMARLERLTGLSSLMLAVLVIYWATRLLYAPHDFARLMRG